MFIQQKQCDSKQRVDYFFSGEMNDFFQKVMMRGGKIDLRMIACIEEKPGFCFFCFNRVTLRSSLNRI